MATIPCVANRPYSELHYIPLFVCFSTLGRLGFCFRLFYNEIDIVLRILGTSHFGYTVSNTLSIRVQNYDQLVANATEN